MTLQLPRSILIVKRGLISKLGDWTGWTRPLVIGRCYIAVFLDFSISEICSPLDGRGGTLSSILWGFV